MSSLILCPLPASVLPGRASWRPCPIQTKRHPTSYSPAARSTLEPVCATQPFYAGQHAYHPVVPPIQFTSGKGLWLFFAQMSWLSTGQTSKDCSVRPGCAPWSRASILSSMDISPIFLQFIIPLVLQPALTWLTYAIVDPQPLPGCPGTFNLFRTAGPWPETLLDGSSSTRFRTFFFFRRIFCAHILSQISLAVAGPQTMHCIT